MPWLRWVKRGYWTLLTRVRLPAWLPGSTAYWERRYRRGGNSGAGSFGQLAQFKAEVVNDFVARNGIRSVIELGCGDGAQLSLARYPSYLGVDVSRSAVERCQQRFSADATKRFRLMDQPGDETADLALSLDVIFHLVEDDSFDRYMRRLFSAALSYVVIYSSNSDDNRGFEGTYIRHRNFSSWIAANATDWTLIQHIPNRHPYVGDDRLGSFADFFIYVRR